jgi:hypothetical protein
MARIYDYNQFSYEGPKKLSRGEYPFICSLGFIDITFENLPDEIGEISDASAVVNYSVYVKADKTGINDLDFTVDMIELVMKIDKYPTGTEEVDFDIAPNKNIENLRILSVKPDKLIPTAPTKIVFNFNKSMNVSNFNVEITFGEE